MDYQIDLIPVSRGFDGRTFWGQARGGSIPSEKNQSPTIVITAQPALRSGSDVYFALSEWRSNNLGKTWNGPVEHTNTLGRRKEKDGTIVAICDMTPGWHKATQTLLSTGHTVRYSDEKHPITARHRETAYATYEPTKRIWTPWQTLEMPHHPEFKNAGAGSTQRFDLEDGTILLPIYFKEISEDWNACHKATVLRCAFDGLRLKYLEHGSELTVPDPRGLCEPSITFYQNRYYLTLRNDVRGYVTESSDGLRFDSPVPWRFDDGSELENYNTQQHWVTHSDALFLVYTRRGLNNDHVFRHRAPLMIAQVDPENLVFCERPKENSFRIVELAWVTSLSVMSLRTKHGWWFQNGCNRKAANNTVVITRFGQPGSYGKSQINW